MRWFYRLTDGVILDPTLVDRSAGIGVIEISGRVPVDLALNRVDLQTRTIRKATADELATRRDELAAARAQVDSRRVDILATIAWVVRRDMGPAQFDALTNAQKKAAILNQADVWKTIRAAIERLVE